MKAGLSPLAAFTSWAVLLPATMKLLGDANWYLPKWLDWLPRLEHEAQAELEAEPAPVLAA